MGEQSKIEWTDATWNSHWGCRKVPGDPACENCYAESLAKRYGHKVWGASKPRRFLSDENWKLPLRWNRKAEEAGVRTRVFCASMGDIFEDRRDLDAVRERLWRLIEQTPSLDWLLLTKRPENLGWLDVSSRHNVWLGTTAVTQRHYDERRPLLLWHDAAVHFISIEPIMEDIDLMLDLQTTDSPRPEWIIVGGESGPRARPLQIVWIERIIAQCKEGRVACFVKQLGHKPGGLVALRDRKGGDATEWPKHLRVRQFPSITKGASP